MKGDYLAALDMHDLDTSAIYGEEYFASEITFLSLSMGNQRRRFHSAFPSNGCISRIGIIAS